MSLPVATIAPLQGLIFVLCPLAATAVVFTHNTLRMLILNGVYGLLLAILFFVFQAPDVSLSIIVVSSIAYPLVVLAAIARVRSRMKDDE